MTWKNEWKALALLSLAFFGCYFLPVGVPRFDRSIMEALHLVKWYAQEHVLLCLVPAFFIAGAIGVFVRQASVIKYLGASANKFLAYGVASVSGTILAVCSCTVLPLFAGIYRRGAGLGPATAFLYSGPAINVLAIVLTARVLGMEIGIARAVGAIVFSVVVGLLMHVIFRGEATEEPPRRSTTEAGRRAPPLGRHPARCIADRDPRLRELGKPVGLAGFLAAVYSAKWIITAVMAASLAVILSAAFRA